MAAKGPKHGYRFDDVKRLYRVMYAADTVLTCVMETMVRNNVVLGWDGELEIDRRSLFRVSSATGLTEQRQISKLEIPSNARFVPFYGPFLTKYGIVNICTWDSYYASQRWSRALYDHPDQYDGLTFVSRFNNSSMSHAIFDRAYTSSSPELVRVIDTQPLATYQPFLNLLDRYDIAIT